MDIIKAVEQEYMRNRFPDIEPGDFVKAHLQIREGDRVRIQVFEGTVIARRGTGLGETITIRRLSYGVGIERVLPVHSPRIENIELVRKGKVRRAKLYYLRKRVGKKARVKEKLVRKEQEA